MSIENKVARFSKNTGPARLLVPIGLILIAAGILLMVFKNDTFVETTGKITAVEAGMLDDSQNQQYDVSVSYTAEGREYTTTFSGLSGSFTKGADFKVYYDPEDPAKATNSKTPAFLGPVLICAGAAALIFGIFKTVQAFRKSKKLDEEVRGGGFAEIDFEAFKKAEGVSEYYFRFDGNSLKPGYLIEDADRKVLFEGKMLKNALVGARTFEFHNHVTGGVQEHQVGHTMTNTMNDEFFSVNSWFKFDGENIWELLHSRGLRMETDLHSKFPYVFYNVTRNGAAFARIENSSLYVHEEDEAQHKLVIPTGRMYYRFWTNSNDFESLFMTMFGITESEQGVVE
ncbi:MAG: DUF3592 domain-containing protein [Lachnospiraceae bacterium]|nr:DUF3592 domain-containing protein [Lachnospiraceae bacterium]MBR5739471.1 DUF3592 domain-containing protein [Lachnospiraceae bacterium]